MWTSHSAGETNNNQRIKYIHRTVYPKVVCAQKKEKVEQDKEDKESASGQAAAAARKWVFQVGPTWKGHLSQAFKETMKCQERKEDLWGETSLAEGTTMARAGSSAAFQE